MRGLAFIGVLGLVACTAPNPAYQVSEEGNGSDADVSTSEDSPTEGSGPADTEVGTSGELACELHPLAPIVIGVAATVLEPDCESPDRMTALGQGNNQYMGGNVIRHSKCDVPICPCTSDSTFDISLGSDVQFAEGVPLPGCGDIHLWPARDADGNCVWAGVVLFHEQTYIPDYIASRTLDVPPLGLELELVEERICPELGQCSGQSPGRYALGVLDEIVTAEEAPRNIEVALGVGELYLFDNRMSSVNESCELELAWTAQRWQ
jgi:hypothetical protein